MKILLLTLIFLSSIFAQSEGELERAYAKEFAFLKAQKQMLSTRVKEVKAKDSKKLKQAKSDVQRLQNTLLKSQSDNELLEENLFRAQQNIQNISDDTAMISSVVMQASSSLRNYGVEISVDNENYPQTLTTIFNKTSELITSLSKVSTVDGKFYLADGTQKSAKIIKIGNIATYGISDKVAGALVPAGDAKLKLWDSPEAALTANMLANNKRPNTLNIFLYENSSKEIDSKEVKTILSVIDSGGIIGWVIVILGVFGLFISGLRAVFLSGSSSRTEEFAPKAVTHLTTGGVDAALKYLDSKKGAIARVLKSTIRNLDRDREHIEDIIAESIMHESERLDKFGTAILVIAAVAPLLGLLGTVTGMIATFDIITEFGTGDPKLLSGGISIALVTTELGLVVAIPLLLIGNLLGGWAEKVKDSMEYSALHLVNEYNKKQ